MFHWFLLPRVPLTRKGHAASVSGRAANGCAVATRCPGGCGGLCWRADEGVRPYDRAYGFRHSHKGQHIGPPQRTGEIPRLPRRGRCPHRPIAEAPVNCQASGSEKRSRDNAMTTPTTSAPSATGRQLQTCRREKRARRQAKIGACTDPPTPVARRRERAGARLSGLFFWTVHGPFLFWQDRKGPPPRPARWGEEEQGSRRSFRRRRKRS